jgi:NAD(P)-dependent dehydrogenase (short-subunit alcohol dehydrogenase family)
LQPDLLRVNVFRRFVAWETEGLRDHGSDGDAEGIGVQACVRGWNAAVTARDPAAIQDIVRDHEATALALRLDVTDAAQIASAIEAAEARFGGIDVLVNNAGYGYRGAVEEADDADIRRLFETNFFDLVAVTKRVLPGMRARRKGHIVNISSVAGRMAQPGSGYYSASKFAVGGLSDALRRELKPLGIGVTVVEPGGFRTDFAGRSLQQSSQTIPDYAQTAGLRRKENITTDGRQPGDPDRAAVAIIHAVEAPTPPLHLVLGRSAVKRVRDELDRQYRELDERTETASGADYPNQA